MTAYYVPARNTFMDNANTRRYYIVTIAAKFPAWGETPTTERVYAKDSADAVKQARAMARRNGYTRQDGPATYRAKLDENQT